ncbi:ribosome silencing factor [Actinospongicola halichondriae]|uniref:ribosome silencing factor n=1 Tax=Actinospongicola halichondriae TaxID=3236844 RepID=UPI003D53A9A2
MSDPRTSITPSTPAEVPDDVDHMDPTHAITAARAAHAKGGTDIVVLRVGDVLAITDYFVIVSASNPRLVRTIVQDVEDVVAASGGPRPIRIEGTAEAEWVLSDYGTFVVHVFHDDIRKYYELERLWSDVASIDWPDPDGPPVGA